jgi:alpha-beta hydrolase superfamily lysophospholipase
VLALQLTNIPALAVVAPPDSKSAPQAAAELSSADKDIIADANTHFWNHDFAYAKQKVELLLSSPLSQPMRARALVNMAICDTQLDNWSHAITEAQKGIALAEKQSLTEVDGLSVLARCLIVDRKNHEAEEIYKQALPTAIQDLGEWNSDLAPIYEGLAACYSNENEPAKAEPLYRKVAQLDLLKYGPDDVHTGWSLLSLTGVQRQLGNNQLATTIYKKVFWNFRHQNEERILTEIKPTEEDRPALVEELRKQMYGFVGGYNDRNQGLDYIKSGIPDVALAAPYSRPHDFDNWFKERIGRDDAPGLAFFDPRQKLKALIVTVHGLGMHHTAYTPFAQRIQHNGFGVISFDVRGFGSYRNDEVYQKVDFDAIIADLQNILTALRRDYPGLPIFILGESMGGAIALRVAALSPDLVDGCVSSVPSGSRFHARTTGMEVAVKLLTDSRAQFDIGRKVVGQATQNADLRTAWEDDPQARMKFSPVDLMAFQHFMNDNVKYAEQIKKTPVIIFQGYSDQLVKPLGTLALYQAIGSRDKDLMFVGHAEHLIFEDNQFDQDVVDGLSSWLDRHISRTATK